jgi:hypothetical protein
MDLELDTIGQLMYFASDLVRMGYDVDITPLSATAEGWTRLTAWTNHPDISGFQGEWWFWSDGKVMQVL